MLSNNVKYPLKWEMVSRVLFHIRNHFDDKRNNRQYWNLCGRVEGVVMTYWMAVIVEGSGSLLLSLAVTFFTHSEPSLF